MTRTLLPTLILALGLAAPAAAESQVWKVGAGYVVRSHDLDLSRRDDRAALLARLEYASATLCRAGVRKARQRCATELRARALAAAPSRERAALAQAVQEREAVQLAKRW